MPKFEKPDIQPVEGEIYYSIANSQQQVSVNNIIQRLTEEKPDIPIVDGYGLDALASKHQVARAFSGSRIRAKQLANLAKRTRRVANRLVNLDIDTTNVDVDILVEELTPETLDCIEAVAAYIPEIDEESLSNPLLVNQILAKMKHKPYNALTFIILILRMAIATTANSTLGFLCDFFKNKVWLPFFIHKAIGSVFGAVERAVLALVGFSCGSNAKNCSPPEGSQEPIITFKCCTPNGFTMMNNPCVQRAVKRVADNALYGQPPCTKASTVYDWSKGQIRPGADISQAQKLAAINTIKTIEEQQVRPELQNSLSYLTAKEKEMNSISQGIDQMDAQIQVLNNPGSKSLNALKTKDAVINNMMNSTGVSRNDDTEELSKAVAALSLRLSLVEKDYNAQTINIEILNSDEKKMFDTRCLSADKIIPQMTKIMNSASEYVTAKYVSYQKNLNIRGHIEKLVSRLHTLGVLRKCSAIKNPGSFSLNTPANFVNQSGTQTMMRVHNVYEQTMDQASYGIKMVGNALTTTRVIVSIICNFGLVLTILIDLFKILLKYGSGTICAAFAGEDISAKFIADLSALTAEIEAKLSTLDHLIEPPSISLFTQTEREQTLFNANGKKKTTASAMIGGDPLFNISIPTKDITATLNAIEVVKSVMETIQLMMNGVSFDILNFKIPLEDMGKMLGEGMLKVGAVLMDPIFGPVKNAVQYIRTLETPIGNVQSLPGISDILNLMMCGIVEVEKVVLDKIYSFFSSLGKDIQIMENIAIRTHRSKWILEILAILDILSKLLKQLADCDKPGVIADNLINEYARHTALHLEGIEQAANEANVNLVELKQDLAYNSRDKEYIPIDSGPLAGLVNMSLQVNDSYLEGLYTDDREKGSLLLNDDIPALLDSLDSEQPKTGYDPERIAQLFADRLNREADYRKQMLLNNEE